MATGVSAKKTLRETAHLGGHKGWLAPSVQSAPGSYTGLPKHLHPVRRMGCECDHVSTCKLEPSKGCTTVCAEVGMVQPYHQVAVAKLAVALE